MTESHPARKIQFVALGLVMAATLVATATMFTPWEQWDVDEQGFESRGTAGLWGYHWRSGELAHDQDSFFDDRETYDSSDQNEISGLRFAAITMVVGLGALVVGAATILLDHKVRAAATATVGGVLVLVATMVHHQNFLDFASFHVHADIGYYLGMGAGFAGLLGGMMAFIPHPGLGLKEAMAAWNKA